VKVASLQLLSTQCNEAGFVLNVARWLGGKSGWQRLALAFFAGVFATLSLPPVFVIPVLYISFPVLCWLLIGVKTKRQAFFVGWFFAFGYLVASLYWISFALLVYSEKLWWVIPFAAVGLPALLAIYGGLVTLSASFVKTGTGRALALALFWWLGEWLRGHMFTGFPWNMVGQSWAGSDALIQIASVIGIYGVTLLALLSCTMGAALPYVKGGVRNVLLGFILILPLGSYVYGQIRLANAPPQQTATDGDGVGIRLVQAGIPQREKWKHNLQLRNFQKNLTLSQKDRPDWIKLVVWPETAASFFLEDAAQALDRIKDMLGPDVMLVTGAPRKEVSKDDYQLYNGVVVVDGAGKVVNSYNKFHLVPFGEYMPYKDILKLDKITYGKKDYSPGAGPRTLDVGNNIPPFSPLVCYEAIFPRSAVNPVQPPDWILNLTNDAWYGETAGPHQHLNLTKLRAIEEGMPLVRVANTGISAVFDSYGREVARLGLSEANILDFRLPKKLTHPSIFSVYGSLLIWIVFFTALLCLATIEKRKK